MSEEIPGVDCENCRPVLKDIDTGAALSPDSAEAKALEVVWSETEDYERGAFHRFICLSSHRPADIRLVCAVQQRIKEALAKLGKSTDRLSH